MRLEFNRPKNGYIKISRFTAYTVSPFEKLTNRTTGTLPVRSRYGRGTVAVRSRYGRGTVAVRSRCGRGTVEIRSWCASGSVRFVNFSTGNTVYIQ